MCDFDTVNLQLFFNINYTNDVSYDSFLYTESLVFTLSVMENNGRFELGDTILCCCFINCLRSRIDFMKIPGSDL